MAKFGGRAQRPCYPSLKSAFVNSDMLDVCGAGSSDCNPTKDGRKYTGHRAITVNGRLCQAWASQSPHKHRYTKDRMFPDGSAKAASNYCRNPSILSLLIGGYLWCYTMDPDTRWEKCDVPICGQLLRYVDYQVYICKAVHTGNSK